MDHWFGLAESAMSGGWRGGSAPWDYPYGNSPFSNDMYSLQRQWAQYDAVPRKLLEPGTTWERTGPRTHRVTIRTEPEWVIDYQKLAELQAQTNQFLFNAMCGQTS